MKKINFSLKTILFVSLFGLFGANLGLKAIETRFGKTTYATTTGNLFVDEAMTKLKPLILNKLNETDLTEETKKEIARNILVNSGIILIDDSRSPENKIKQLHNLLVNNNIIFSKIIIP